MACWLTGTKPLPEPMLTHHQWCPVTFILGQSHNRCLNHQSLKANELNCWMLDFFQYIFYCLCVRPVYKLARSITPNRHLKLLFFYGGPERSSLPKFFNALHKFWLVWKKMLFDYVYIIILQVYINILHVYINILHVYIIILHVYIIVLYVYINISHVYIINSLRPSDAYMRQ